MSERAGTPFHCPFCGETDLWPHVTASGESPHGSWECRGCLRAFQLKSLGMIARSVTS
jgi:transposase-like protein